jgi:hypothetical protein
MKYEMTIPPDRFWETRRATCVEHDDGFIAFRFPVDRVRERLSDWGIRDRKRDDVVDGKINDVGELCSASFCLWLIERVSNDGRTVCEFEKVDDRFSSVSWGDEKWCYTTLVKSVDGDHVRCCANGCILSVAILIMMK